MVYISMVMRHDESLSLSGWECYAQL